MNLTDKQKSLIDSLLIDKVEPSQHSNWRYHMANAADRETLDRGFQKLFALPRISGAVQPHSIAPAKLPNVPTAHYALFEYGEYHFYRVDRPTEGNWAGRTFVKIQASDDYYPIKDTLRVVRILESIASDPEQALADYGHQIGRCGICNRTLTDAESIDKGIGPICASKL